MSRFPARSSAAIALGLASVALLAGCAVTASPQPTSSRPESPSPSASSPAPGTAERGCPAGGGDIPAGAATAKIADVDGDGRLDTEFYSQSPPFEYGIRTASGATLILKNRLAGPGTHGGWTSIREGGTVTVVDDGRTAHLWALIDCHFVRSTDRAGKPYTFALGGFGQYGTGVACRDQNGAALLFGVLADRQPDGTYAITETNVNLVAGGRIAENNGGPQPVASGLARDDPRVRLAMKSTCGDTPIVRTKN